MNSTRTSKNNILQLFYLISDAELPLTDWIRYQELRHYPLSDWYPERQSANLSAEQVRYLFELSQRYPKENPFRIPHRKSRTTKPFFQELIYQISLTRLATDSVSQSRYDKIKPNHMTPRDIEFLESMIVSYPKSIRRDHD